MLKTAVKCDRKFFRSSPPREDSSKAAKDSFSPTWPADHQQSDSAGSVHFDAHLPAAAPGGRAARFRPRRAPRDRRRRGGHRARRCRRRGRRDARSAAAAAAAAAKKIVLPASVQCPIVTIYSALRGGGLLGFGFGAISGAWQWQAYQSGTFGVYA